MKIKVFLLAIALFSANISANDHIVNDYKLVIYQSNCFTQSVIYTVDYDDKPKIIATAIVDAISEEKLLGNSGNLKFTDGACSLLNCCLERLSINYALATKSDQPINLEMIVIGIAGYNDFKDDLYNEKINRLNYFEDFLYQSLEQNKFTYNKETIEILHDVSLVNNISSQLIEDNRITPRKVDINAPYDRVWTFLLSSILVGIRSNDEFLETPVTIYLNNNEGGYYKLGEDTAELFTNIEDENNLGSNKVQQLINNSPLSKQLLSERSYTLGYWLKDRPQQASRNNARGLAVVEYVLKNDKITANKQNNDASINLKIKNKTAYETEHVAQVEVSQPVLVHNDPNDTSVTVVQQYTLDLIAQSVDLIKNLILIESEETSINENDIILISGELLRCNFIKENYKKIIDEKIPDSNITDRIQVVDQEDFIYGLTLAAEFINENTYYEVDENELALSDIPKINKDIKNLNLSDSGSKDSLEVFVGNSDSNLSEI